MNKRQKKKFIKKIIIKDINYSNLIHNRMKINCKKYQVCNTNFINLIARCDLTKDMDQYLQYPIDYRYTYLLHVYTDEHCVIFDIYYMSKCGSVIIRDNKIANIDFSKGYDNLTYHEHMEELKMKYIGKDVEVIYEQEAEKEIY